MTMFEILTKEIRKALFEAEEARKNNDQYTYILKSGIAIGLERALAIDTAIRFEVIEDFLKGLTALFFHLFSQKFFEKVLTFY